MGERGNLLGHIIYTVAILNAAILDSTSVSHTGLKGSLQRLQLEYVDVVFANRPDSNTPMEGPPQDHHRAGIMWVVDHSQHCSDTDVIGMCQPKLSRAASCGQHPQTTDEGLEDDQHCTVQQQMSYRLCLYIYKVDQQEIVRAMTYVINQGMAMYWGTSRWTAMEIMEAYSVARQFNLIPPVCEQAEYHLFQREKVEVQLPELYHKIGRWVGAMTWSPLACGIITGKYENGIPESSRASMKSYQWLKDKIMSEDGRKQQAKLKELAHIAEKLGCTLPQLAVAWCLRNEGVSSVLLGTSNPEQLTENLGAIQVLPKMTSHVVSEIDHILGNRPYSKKDYRS
ncbi:hypothetical protein NFI96_004075 [Prochilodus magdalenae]|nr:hypothetical protein NFI96_004075 [Prochilodus magdalenae]